MSFEIKNQSCLRLPSLGGLLAFLATWALLGYSIESDKNQLFGLALQTGSIPVLNPDPDLPTGPAQGCTGPALIVTMGTTGASPGIYNVMCIHGRDG
jgi:hypothetical protein